MRKEYTYTINLEPAEEGGYVVTVPALPGCHTEGDTYEAALENAKDAIKGYLIFLQKLGEPIPVENYHPRKLHSQVRIPAMA